MKPRVEPVPVDPRILSSYGPKGTGADQPRSTLKTAASIGGKMPPDAAAALLALHEAVAAAGGDLRITDLYRSVATQAAARARYDAWVAAGRPAPGSAGWNSATMKKDFVAFPGRSWHNAGRAIDIHLAALRFPGVPADKQLDTLWDIARKIGWTPIIKAPEENVSEAWHFDYFGFWSRVKAKIGYEGAAIAAAQDIANGEVPAEERRLQGGLHRAGYDVGAVDGVVGRTTRAGLAASGYQGAEGDLAAAVAHVDRLPTATAYLWPAASVA
jgi:hypothetical protein